MSIIDEALSANATIANDYDPSLVKPPAPKIAVVTCADPRLTIIEHMLGLAAGDVDMIRGFGTVIDDDAIRSLVLFDQAAGQPGDNDHQSTPTAGCSGSPTASSRTGSARRQGARRSRGQVLQLHRRRGEHQGADLEDPVTSMDLAGRSSQGIRF